MQALYRCSILHILANLLPVLLPVEHNDRAEDVILGGLPAPALDRLILVLFEICFQLMEVNIGVDDLLQREDRRCWNMALYFFNLLI